MEATALRPAAERSNADRRPVPSAVMLEVAGARFVPDCAGALYWPDERTLVVADLHLEKGSALAARGLLVPPYDTAETLARLARLIGRYDPRCLVALGDNFHDGGGSARLRPPERATLDILQRGRDWVWIAGNHDPDPAAGVGGVFAEQIVLGPVVFRHAPRACAAAAGSCGGEIAGHLHPCARISVRGRTIARRCFATDGTRLVMPAFGAFAGGLDIRDRAFGAVFGGKPFEVHLIGAQRTYAFAAEACAG